MLELKYRPDHLAVEATLTQEFESWPAIRRAFEDSAEDIAVVRAYTIRLPVWSFLACRRALVYVLRKHQVPFNADDNVKNILQTAIAREDGYRTALEVSLVPLDSLMTKLTEEGFVRPLTRHQIRNVLRLSSLPSGATFSVPGAGKTTEALAVYCFKRNVGNRLLVVCPKNAFAAWEEQVNLCLSHPPHVARLTGGIRSIQKALKSNTDIFLITYQQLPSARRLLADFMVAHRTFMFLDESHRIKRGSAGYWGGSVLSLSHLPESKLLMTGTPLPNAITDLIPQFNFIFPEVNADAESIQSLIKPVFVRTTKSELGLPEVTRILTPIPLRPNHRHLYELLRSEEARQLARLRSRDSARLRRIGRSVVRLLQLASNPALLARNEVNLSSELGSVLEEGDSPKIEYACYRARRLAQRGQKTVIWSTFVENVETIALRLRDIGADFIHGGVEAGSDEEGETRERKLKRFHDDPQAFVLVANPAACAEGISLHTVCHYAIYVDRNYNAAQYLQSVDRIHRLGLAPDTVTTVEILYSADTIDESVHRRLNSKMTLMAEVLDDNSINREPVESDLESDGVDDEDLRDFLHHLGLE